MIRIYDINGINYGRHKISDKDFYWLNKLANKILYISDNRVTEYSGNYDYFIEHNML